MSSRSSRFDQLSPAKQKLLLARLGKQGRAAQAEAIGPSPRRAAGGPYPLSFSQQRLWFIDQMQPGGSAYVLADALRLRGRLDRGALERSLAEIVRRHEALRTVFALAEEGPVQRVTPPGGLRLGLVDLADLPREAREREARRLMRAEVRTPFDLARGPQLRARLLRLAADEHVALLSMHHIVSDGWSLGILVREISALYGAFAAGRPSPLPELPVQYPDFADWQRRTLAGEALAGHLGYWREALAGAPVTLDLPTDRPRPPLQSTRGATVQTTVPPALSASLAALGRSDGNTLFMLLLAGFGALLSRHSGQQDLLVGAPIANRNRQETEGLIGFFVNTLVLRVTLAGAAAFDDLLARVRRVTLGAFEHQDLPFERLVEELQPERDLSRAPLVQTSFALQNAPLGDLALGDLSLGSVELPAESAALDVVLEAVETGDGIAMVWHYAVDLFDRTTVERLAVHLERLLAAVAEDPRRPLADLPLLSAAERHQLLAEWNDEPPSYPAGDLLLPARMQAVAERFPAAPAVVLEGDALSYRSLDRRANRLARRLRELGAGPEAVVAIAAERSFEMMIGLLAIWKAGAAYLPLDPELPDERLGWMIGDAAPVAVLVQPRLAPRLLPLAGKGARTTLLLDPAELAAEDPLPPPSGLLLDHPAYVLYTSGSTGRPKGVVVTHRAAGNHMAYHAAADLATGVRELGRTTFGFDVSVLELFGSFLVGGTLVLARPGGQADLPYLMRLIAEEQVTNALLMPAMIALVADERGMLARIPSLRVVVTGGEAFPPEVPERFYREMGRGAVIYNRYGPTETTIAVTDWPCAPDAGLTTVPIGRPITGAAIFVADADFRPTPLGVPGELLIGGVCLARGYLGRPDLTAERFVPHPWSAEPGARLYRSGDLGRHRADGALEFLGRLDRQVKVRGFRVELGEIEAALAEHPAVRQVAVTLRPSPAGPRLLAWVSPAEGVSLDVAALRDDLRRRLPEFMVPGAFGVLPELPLNTNRKVDRKALDALPEPLAERSEAAAFVAPAAGLESAIAAIWREVLDREEVGSGDGFFDLGGHSLLLVRVQAKLRERLGEEVSMVELFRHPTIATLAAYLEGRRGGEALAAAAPRRPAVAPPQSPADRAVAIVSMAGRFPGAPDLETFWENLAGGVESISFFTREELAQAGVPEEALAEPGFVPAGGVLAGADLFDAGYFGINPREAELLDPQQRVFLECAVEALERAGYGSDLRRGRVGVFAGSGSISYAIKNLLGRVEADPFEVTLGNDKDFLATRAAYKLDLTGPALTVQTACSTALVAVHLAAQSLLAGECELALAGGVTLEFPQRAGYVYTEGGIASPDGHNRAFDARAGGTVGGNGVGVVALKPLAAALADGDPIHAVLKGSALNNDGAARMGYTTPSEEGQAAAIQAAQAAACVHPATVQYVECHGSATPIGDPIEVAALARAFRAGGADGSGGRTAIGSVKTNVGHTGSAAGIAGLLKTALALAHRQIPPSLHFEHPNPAIDFAASPFYVSTALADWPANRAADGTGGEIPRRAGVSSFGIGGTNVHAVLEEAPQRPPRPPADAGRPWQLLSISARTPSALEAATGRLVDHLRRHPEEDLADVAFTLHAGRRGWEHRRALVCRDREDAVAALAARDPARLLESRTLPEGRPGRPVAFLLAGIGEQYAGLAAGLYRDEPAFREPLARCAEILAPLGVDLAGLFAAAPEKKGSDSGPDLRRMLGRGGPDPTTPTAAPATPLDDTAVLQPALFAIEYALAQLWMEWGVVPRALLGYSLGEYLAACLAGVLPLADALQLVARRARLIADLPPGAMLATPLGEAELAAAIAEVGAGELAVAAVNGPGHAVAAGPPEAVALLAERLAAAGHATRRLRTDRAFHSPMMRPAAAELTALARTMRLAAPRIPYLSNVTGTWIRPEQATDPGYWAEHLCRTVRFGDAVAELWREPDRALLEIGPGQSLSALALQHPAAAGSADPVAVASLPSAYERQGDRPFLLGALAKLWLAGVTIDWERVYGRERRRRVELPTYPFERRRYWAGEGAVAVRPAAPATSPAAGKAGAGGPRLYLPSWRRTAMSPISPMSRPPRPGELAASGRRWLVFADRAGLGARIAALLAADGADAVTVVAGDRFERTGEAEFTVDPRQAEHVDLLLDALGRPLPDRVVHLWGLDSAEGAAPPDGIDAASLAAAHARGFASLLTLVHGLAARLAPDASGEGGGALAALVAASGLAPLTAADRLVPERAPLAALCRSLPHELPGVVCRAVDIDPPAPGSWQEEALAGALLAELARSHVSPDSDPGLDAGPDDGVSLAYRGGERWVRIFEAFAYGSEPLSATAGDAAGGEAPGAVVLVGRPEGRLGEARRALAELGREATLVEDTADEAALREALAAAESRAGGLAGVIAELDLDLPEAPLVALRRGDVETALQGAAGRLSALGRALAGRRLPFVLLGSSLDAFAAPAGGTLGAAVAALADAFARERRRAGAAPWTTVAWGVADGAPALAPLLPLLAAPGAPAQLVLSNDDLPARLRARLAASAAAAEAGMATPLHGRPNLRNPYVPPSTESERAVCEICQLLLGIDQVGIHDSFLDLGGDSLLATQLVTRVRERLGARVTLPEFFEIPTAAALASRIDAQRDAAATAEPDVASLVAQLASLSAEEVEAMLAARGLPGDAAEGEGTEI